MTAPRLERYRGRRADDFTTPQLEDARGFLAGDAAEHLAGEIGVRGLVARELPCPSGGGRGSSASGLPGL